MPGTMVPCIAALERKRKYLGFAIICMILGSETMYNYVGTMQRPWRSKVLRRRRTKPNCAAAAASYGKEYVMGTLARERESGDSRARGKTKIRGQRVGTGDK